MQSRYDVVVLGAGINGSAIAKALAQKGKSVLVLEKGRIASGASSHSSRLIHGGLRYLENFEFSLVREALHDRNYLLENYPDLVKLRDFYLPLYKNSRRPAWMIRLGLWLYTFLARHGQKAQEVDKALFLKKFKALKADNLKAVFRYSDGKTDDYALTCRIADEAEAFGAQIVEGTEIKSIGIDDKEIHIEVAGGGSVSTRVLVNATGAWVDEVNARFGLPSSYTIEKLSGIHLVIDRVLVPDPLFLETATKRIFFIIPEKETTLIGTTERSETGEVDKIKVNNDDIEYLLRESNVYLKKALTRRDIKEVFIGTRPIIKSAKEPTRMSREYKLDLHRIGKSTLLHVYGGKLTTFPSLAKRVAKVLGVS
jgi:glycerol-3-phosphate dehydrogenase